MDYAELFGKIIDESKISANKISKLCTELGEDFSSTYISQIRNRKKAPPSDKVSRVVAKACGKDENLLVLQKYYDNSPEELRKILDDLRDILSFVLIAITSSSASQSKVVMIQEEISKMPIAELIMKASANNPDDVKKAISTLSPSEMLNSNESGYPVQDDAMAPKIPHGAEVFTFSYDDPTEYKDGSILCYHIHGNEAFYIREVRFLNDEHTTFKTFAYNSKYPSETLSMDEVFVYGKVTGMFVGFYDDE